MPLKRHRGFKFFICKLFFYFYCGLDGGQLFVQDVSAGIRKPPVRLRLPGALNVCLQTIFLPLPRAGWRPVVCTGCLCGYKKTPGSLALAGGFQRLFTNYFSTFTAGWMAASCLYRSRLQAYSDSARLSSSLANSGLSRMRPLKRFSPLI